MTLDSNDVKNLQKLVKSSLIEINRLKLDVNKLKSENKSLKNTANVDDIKAQFDEDLKNKDNEINDLKNKFAEDLESKNKELDDLKLKHSDEINSLKEVHENNIKDKDSKISSLNESMASAGEKVKDVESKLTVVEDKLASKEDVISRQLNQIENLTNQIADLKEVNSSLSRMKESLDVEFNNFKTLELNEINLKLKEALNEVQSKDLEIQSKNNEIQAISNDLKVAESKIIGLNQEFADYKHEAATNEVKLATALNSIDTKDAEINNLNLKIDSQMNLINDLKNNLVNKDSLIALQRELDNKELSLKEKDVQIKVLKEKSVSKEDFNQVQNELSKKELQIKRLNEVKDLFFELSDKEPVSSILDEEIVNNVSDDDSYLLELNEIKKDLEEAKENNLKFQSVGDSASNEELNALKEEIKGYKSSIEELEKIKVIYEKLTAPQLKDLTSIQSQIYQLIPDEPMDTLAIKNYMNEIAFENLTFANTKNILKSLEKKGYVEGSVNDQDITFWMKVKKEE